MNLSGKLVTHFVFARVFFSGSIMAVTVADAYAPGKTNRFVGICIQRTGHGLRASFILRNIVDGLGS